MTVREQRNRPLQAPEATDEPVSACRYIGGTLPARTPVPVDAPTRNKPLDLVHGLALVVTVIPFGQILLNLGGAGESGQFAGPHRPHPWTHKNLGEGNAGKPTGERAGLRFTMVGECDLGLAGMLA